MTTMNSTGLADERYAGFETRVTTTNLIRTSRGHMEVCKIESPMEPWLVLRHSPADGKLTLSRCTGAGGVYAGGPGGGAVQPSTLLSYNPNTPHGIDYGLAEYDRVRAELLRELTGLDSTTEATPASKSTTAGTAYDRAGRPKGRDIEQTWFELNPAARAPEQVPAGGGAPGSPSRSKRVVWGVAFVAGLFVLSVLLGPKAGPSDAQGVRTAALSSEAAAEALSRQLPGATPPEAWNNLSQGERIALLQAARQGADSAVAGKTNPEAVATLVAALTHANPVGTVAATGAPGGTPAMRTDVTLSPDELKKVTAASQIRFGTGSTVFYGFVDPMCSSCQELERDLKSLDPKYSFIALPVGFKVGGRDQAAAVMCSTDKVAAWRKAAAVQVVGTKPCEEGYRQVDANNALFLSLKFGYTPTLVAPNAKTVVGAADAVTVAAWVDANRK